MEKKLSTALRVAGQQRKPYSFLGGSGVGWAPPIPINLHPCLHTSLLPSLVNVQQCVASWLALNISVVLFGRSLWRAGLFCR